MDRLEDPGAMEAPDFEVTLLEPRPFRPFKTSEEYLYAMKEDLAEWLNGLYEGLQMDADNFFEQMETGVILCQHANNVVRKARDYYRGGGTVPGDVPIPDRDVVYRYDVLPETFHARDNVSNFISWCRSLNIKECLLFETDDLVLRKNERSFILCLLEVARRGVKFGMPAPLLVQLEQEIDAEIANDDDGYETLFRQAPQVVTNDLRSLHERVVALLSRCTCPSQFPMIRVADGKYRIGDTKVLIFVRILRSHVMVRVGGGWDTLEHYLDKHDPCRCKSGHRLATSAKLTMMQGKSSIPSMHVTYNRPSQPPSSPPSSPQGVRRNIMAFTSPTLNRRHHNHHHHHQSSPPGGHRSIPPAPPCSDDSSNSSIHEGLERRNSKPFDSQVCGTSSEDEEVESDDGRGEYRVPRRRLITKRELLKDTVSSSWRYSPGIPRKDYQHLSSGINGGIQRKLSNDGHGSRLPAMMQISETKQPPKVGKVSPRPHYQSNWNDQRSQSSEDLLQGHSSGPAQPRALVFHSRGSSPVNLKGRTTLQTTDRSLGEGFRRNDPKRHSSPRINQRLSPPKPPTRRNVAPTTGIHRQIAPVQTPTRRMFWSPERQSNTGIANKIANRKNSAPTIESYSSPVVEKLLQHSDLCSDEAFLKKIEQLIAEYQTKPTIGLEDNDESYNRGRVKFVSLPPTLKDDLDSKPSLVNFHQRRSPVENNSNKSPSKIPLPTWYPKCHI